MLRYVKCDGETEIGAMAAHVQKPCKTLLIKKDAHNSKNGCISQNSQLELEVQVISTQMKQVGLK